MKQTISILFLLLLLFNWCGYRTFTSLLEVSAEVNFESELDNMHYDEAGLISIKRPLGHLSAYTNSTAFERVDGRIEISGVQYNYVKRRIYNDSIEVLCVPNDRLTRLKNNKIAFFKLVNDFQHSGADKKSAISKSFMPDYTICASFCMHILTYTTRNRSAHFLLIPSSGYRTSVEQPPNQAV